MKRKKRTLTYHFFIAAALLIAAYAAVYALLEQDVLSHCDYDNFTRQAAAWWQGQAALAENPSWLEVAEYGGAYYSSFPPFPAVVQFLLYPIFGMATPNNLVNTLFGFFSFVLIYFLLRKREYSGLAAAAAALLLTLGSNLFYLSSSGWVWFSAQTQSFFFSVLSVYLIHSKRKVAWYFAFLALGLAFACRPFQIVYLPVLVYMLYNNQTGEKGKLRAWFSCGKYLLPLAAVGVLVAVYNYIRFDSFFEFGHNYLPEFQSDAQFSARYIPGNFLEILKLPRIEDGRLALPQFNGTLFFVVNPVFIWLAVSFFRSRFGLKKALYIACSLAHLVLLLAHRTMGGWQFGARYLVDLIPFMLIVFADDGRYKMDLGGKQPVLPGVLLAAGAAINIYGTIWFFSL